MNSKQNWWANFLSHHNQCKTCTTRDIVRLVLVCLVILSFSLNLFYKISLDGAFVHGLLVDYLIPKFYVAEVFLLAFLLLEIKTISQIKFDRSFFYLIGPLIILLLARQFYGNNFYSAWNYLLHVAEWGLFFYLVRGDAFLRGRFAQFWITIAMLGVVVMQSLLSIYQFIFGKSLFAYYILGETDLRNLANISHAQFFDAERILPYGTLAHPNILAGLVVTLSILLVNRVGQRPLSRILILVDALLIVVLTQSLSALLTLLLFAVYLLLKKIRSNSPARTITTIAIYCLFTLGIPYTLSRIATSMPQNDSISRRASLDQVAWQMFIKHPFIGIGINNFTRELENYSVNLPKREIVRFIQPVHHLPLLILSEGGLLFVAIFLAIVREIKIRHFWENTIILLAIVCLDHYLLSQFAGLGILSFFYLYQTDTTQT